MGRVVALLGDLDRMLNGHRNPRSKENEEEMMAADLLPRRNGRFALQRMTSIEWIVVDGSHGPKSPRRTVACIYEVDEFEYDVTWLRDLGLPAKYMSPADVLEDIRKAADRSTRIPSQKPIPIPHRPPLAAMG